MGHRFTQIFNRREDKVHRETKFDRRRTQTTADAFILFGTGPAEGGTHGLHGFHQLR
jgi:hypothetical protein